MEATVVFINTLSFVDDHFKKYVAESYDFLGKITISLRIGDHKTETETKCNKRLHV